MEDKCTKFISLSVSRSGQISGPGVPLSVAARIGEDAERAERNFRYGGPVFRTFRKTMVLQDAARAGSTISFTVSQDDLKDALTILEENKEPLTIKNITHNEGVAKVSIVGAGMMTNPGVASKLFEALFNYGININMISTSEIRITVLVEESEIDKAVRAIHEKFDLAE